MAENKIMIDVSHTLENLNSIGNLIENTEPLFEDIAEILLESIDDNFRAEEGPGGTPWLDLAESTKRQREKAGTWPGKKLQSQTVGSRGSGSGLLGSLQTYSDEEMAAVTSDKPYAAIHHFGGNAGPGRKVYIPARPYAYLGEDAEQEIRDAISSHLVADYIQNQFK
jgi:phage virion morphogenesis protein